MPRLRAATLAAFSLALAAAGSGRAAVADADLAKPPADATRLLMVSSSAQHGQTWRWTDAKGVRWSRESINLRGLINETDQAAALAPDGTLASLVVRGHTPQGDAAETFAAAGGQATWTSPIDKGAKAETGALYIAFGGTNDATALEIEALAAAPGHRLALLPSGEARLEPLATAEIGAGPTRKTARAWNLLGVTTSPFPVWTDEAGHFVAAVNPAISIIDATYRDEVTRLLDIQTKAQAAAAPRLLAALLQPAGGPVAFTHVRLFDAEAKTFRPHMTVVVEGGRIGAVGPAASTAVPAGARVIDGAGMTLLPGLWDMHQHVADDFSGPLLLSLGVTSVRDPGNDNAATLDRARRRAAGTLLAPHVYPSVLIDGVSPYTAQSGTTAASLDEALAAVRKAKADGFTGVKIYGSFNPAWVAATAAEAHRLGLHVHGHIPAGMRPLEAVNAGYDEITHINFVMMQAMPDAVVAKSNTSQRFEGTARNAAHVDLAAEPMASLIATLAARHITVDPTLVAFEGMMSDDPGEVSAAYAPLIGTLPPATERQVRGEGFAPAAGSSRAEYRASFARLQALVAALHKAGVRVVAGTDGTGLELPRELELYVGAGLTPAEALEAATLDAARDVGVDKETGSIAAGKAADLVLVAGDPSMRIGDVRQTRWVMMGGRLMDADALRTAAGITGRPH